MGDSVSELSNQFGVSVAVVHAMEYLKKAGWFPWLSEHSTAINRVVSLSIATATSIGFKMALSQGDWIHGGTVMITFPSLSVILDTLIHIIAQYGAQEGYYRIAVKPQETKE